MDDLVGIGGAMGRSSKDVPFQRETFCAKAMLQSIEMMQLIPAGWDSGRRAWICVK
jgi:hypothetical protein